MTIFFQIDNLYFCSDEEVRFICQFSCMCSVYSKNMIPGRQTNHSLSLFN